MAEVCMLLGAFFVAMFVLLVVMIVQVTWHPIVGPGYLVLFILAVMTTLWVINRVVKDRNIGLSERQREMVARAWRVKHKVATTKMYLGLWAKSKTTVRVQLYKYVFPEGHILYEEPIGVDFGGHEFPDKLWRKKVFVGLVGYDGYGGGSWDSAYFDRQWEE